MTKRTLKVQIYRVISPISLSVFMMISGCGTMETVKGDVIKVDHRTLTPDTWGYRLVPKGSDSAILQKVELCPVQERKVFQEVKVTHESAAVSATAGVGCTVTKIGEVSQKIFGLRVDDPSNCRGRSVTDREPTGRQITGEWETIRKEECGNHQPVNSGGKVRLLFRKSREVFEYTLTDNGKIQFSREDLAKLRLYFTILHEMEIEVNYQGANWNQQLSLE